MAESDETDDSQRTEDPTPKKLAEARKNGQVPMSKEINTWLLLLVSTIVVAGMGPSMMRQLAILLEAVIEQSWQAFGSPGVMQVLKALFFEVLGIIIAPFLVLMVAAVAGSFGQIGLIYSPESLKPKFDKLSPVAGFSRLFSMRSFFEFLKGLAKVAIISCVSWTVLKPFMGGLDRVITLAEPDLLQEMSTIFIKLMSAILMVLFLLAFGDLIFQRYSFYKQMRMSKQEIKDEFKQTEGDPHIRSRLRQIRMERARKRMMTNVPKSTVVITNPTHYAVALRYEPAEMDAPVCTAKGLDLIALRIRELAEEHGVVIVENPPLARTLHKSMEVDETIPPEHYKAVAEVISYVFRLKKKL